MCLLTVVNIEIAFCVSYFVSILIYIFDTTLLYMLMCVMLLRLYMYVLYVLYVLYV